jgi:uncharacterized NAD-dependent epimerase/dehydratase family protein
MGSESRRLAILAEGTLDFHHGKTAISLLRYAPQDVVAVIDSENRGKTTGELLGVGGAIPIVGAVEETFPYEPTALVIGIAPFGGWLPEAWRREILAAIEHGMDVVGGLHFMLGDDPEFTAAAERHAVQLVDVRRPPADLPLATFAAHRPGSHVVTFVGSDCAVGKMTAALEMRDAAKRMGLSAGFVATGQTGIMLEGEGIAIDRVVGDFMAGAVEQMVCESAEHHDWVFVEGQGSLLHPAYSGVTLALIHGSAPDAMILVHPPQQTQIDSYPVAIPPLPALVQLYEEAAGWIKAAPVAGIALNTRGMDDGDARDAVAAAEKATGLPATDPVRFGGEKLVEALVERLTPQGATAR